MPFFDFGVVTGVELDSGVVFELAVRARFDGGCPFFWLMISNELQNFAQKEKLAPK